MTKVEEEEEEAAKEAKMRGHWYWHQHRRWHRRGISVGTGGKKDSKYFLL